MNGWKKTLAPILLAITGMVFLLMAVEERFIARGPLHNQWFGLAIMWFAIAIGLFVRSRKPGGGAGPPNA